ncbi:MAG: metallophosphoesterase family protein [Burkholderiaceae bacterium]
MNNTVLRIAHLSDLHFIVTNDGRPAKHGHSVNSLRKISSLLDEQKPDCLLITGDITDRGDWISFREAYQWIHGEIFVDNEWIGLHAKNKNLKVIIVPGNHDAYNSSRWGGMQNRWQKSLRNYYDNFKEYAFKDQDSVDYIWISKDNLKVFISRIDSCYIGGKETDAYAYGGFPPADKIAKGKISLRQSEKIFSLYDQAIQGKLQTESGETIKRNEFLYSLKIVAMHHYLFQPADDKAEKLLEVDDAKDIFQNLAMADFDILLCGHKHIGDIYLTNYLSHFDPRGKLSLSLNYLHRICGLPTLPLKTDNHHRPFAQSLRFIIPFLAISKAKGATLSNENVEDIISILEHSLDNPILIMDELRNYLEQRPFIKGTGIIGEQELRNLYIKIREKLPNDELSHRNKVIAKPLNSLFRKLNSRQFIQVMAASSAKSTGIHSKARAINIYDITSEENKFCFSVNTFHWDNNAVAPDGTKGDFSSPVVSKYYFPYDRIDLKMDKTL